MVPFLQRVNCVAAFDGGEMIGVSVDQPFQMTVPGGRAVPMRGLTWAGVLPTHRRRGALRAMFDRQHADMREQGLPVSGLFAAATDIYHRFGYGPATLTVAEAEVDSNHGAFAVPFQDPGQHRAAARSLPGRGRPRGAGAIAAADPGRARSRRRGHRRNVRGGRARRVPDRPPRRRRRLRRLRQLPGEERVDARGAAAGAGPGAGAADGGARGGGRDLALPARRRADQLGADLQPPARRPDPLAAGRVALPPRQADRRRAVAVAAGRVRRAGGAPLSGRRRAGAGAGRGRPAARGARRRGELHAHRPRRPRSRWTPRRLPPRSWAATGSRRSAMRCGCARSSPAPACGPIRCSGPSASPGAATSSKGEPHATRQHQPAGVQPDTGAAGLQLARGGAGPGDRRGADGRDPVRAAAGRGQLPLPLRVRLRGVAAAGVRVGNAARPGWGSRAGGR